MQKNDTTKLACALQTIVSVLKSACLMTVEIARLFTKKKGKLNLNQMTKMAKKNELLFKSML